MTLNPWRLRLLCQLETLGTVRAVALAAHQSASSVSQQLAVLEREPVHGCWSGPAAGCS